MSKIGYARVLAISQNFEMQINLLKTEGCIKIFSVMSGFAELKTDLNRERTLEGLNEAKVRGRKGGRHSVTEDVKTMLCIYIIIQSYQVMRSRIKREFEKSEGAN
ncbi:hypothetical protein [Mammaliicoccus sciuri]|uniref:hypothetical protein n=1 Tax=Mammaliicoccus sciuri TaxID=1296 RepID=UPI003F551F95